MKKQATYMAIQLFQKYTPKPHKEFETMKGDLEYEETYWL